MVTSRNASTMAMKSPSASTSPATYAAAEAELVGRPQQAADGIGRIDSQGAWRALATGRTSAVDRAAVPELDAYRRDAPKHRPQQRRERLGDGLRLDVCSHSLPL